MTVTLGILGCGTIGSAVAERVAAGGVPGIELAAVWNRTTATAEDLAGRLDAPVTVADEPVELAEHADVVVEAAAQPVVHDTLACLLERGADVVVLSVGAFTDPAFHETIRDTARQTATRVLVPSGAIAGLDGIRALAHGNVTDATLTGHLPQDRTQPYLDHPDAPSSIADGTVIFDGTAADAAQSFPAHMNIAMALTLAADLPPDAVHVRLIVDESAPRNRYVVTAAEAAGTTITTTITNVTDPAIGNTSRLVVTSTLALLNHLTTPIQIGS